MKFECVLVEMKSEVVCKLVRATNVINPGHFSFVQGKKTKTIKRLKKLNAIAPCIVMC